MTPTITSPEQILLTTSIGHSVYDALVQANMDPRLVSVAAIERLLNTERARRSEPGWQDKDFPVSVCG